MSVAQNSDARSSEAVRLVEELRQARLEDQQSFSSRMAQMEKVLKQQLEVAENALKSINTLRQELDTSRAESRSLRQKLTESSWKISSLSEQQTRAQQAQAQSTAQAAEREKLMMKRAEEIAAQFNQMQNSPVVNTPFPPRQPSPPRPPVGSSMSTVAGPSQPRQPRQPQRGSAGMEYPPVSAGPSSVPYSQP